MKKNTRAILALIIAVSMVLMILIPSVVFFTDAVSASSSKLQQENQLAADAKKKRDEAANERKSLEQENQKLNSEIESLAGDIESLNSDISELQRKIEENEEKIKALDSEIDESDELLKSRLRVMYEQGTASYLDVLFSAKGLSDVLLRFEMVTQLYEHDQELISELAAKRDESKAAKEQVEKDKALVVSQRNSLVSKQAEFDSKVSENNSQVEELKKDEAYYAKMQKEHEQEAANILAEINAQKRAAAAAASVSSNSSSGKVVSAGNGALGLPCYAGAPITSEFGYRTLRGSKNYHTGIDFGVPTGTAVRAAADGVVLAAGWRGSYGNCVTIDHGNLVTLYAHNSALNVSAGQKVVKGQQIAASGNTGNSTGPHIHFSVIVNGQYVNPRPYLW